jgi:arylsulfatase A-like enzyme
LAAGHKPDGQSFASYLRDRPGAMPHRTWILNEYHQTRVVRDERFKLYSDGRLFDANADPAEQHDLAASRDPTILSARQRLEQALASLPPDSPPPFSLRSLSAFKINGEAQDKDK